MRADGRKGVEKRRDQEEEIRKMKNEAKRKERRIARARQKERGRDTLPARKLG